MKTGPSCLLVTSVVASLALTAARAAVYPFAEYHLGEAGSLTSVYNYPVDTGGSYRHLFNSSPNSKDAVVRTSVSPMAIGSTACLDTSVAGEQAWAGDPYSLVQTLPKNNFAFGIFVQSPSLGASSGATVFSLGNAANSIGLGLNSSGWAAQMYQGASIPGLAGTFAPNTWVHLAVIRTGNVTRFYIDGVDQGGTITTEPVHYSAGLGGRYGDLYSNTFNGMLDEARVVTFTEGETTANILTALQAGAVPTAFVTVGQNVSYSKASLSPAETSVFRMGGAVQDSVKLTDTDGLQIGGTDPQKHIIQISQEGFIAAGRYPLITYKGAIGGQGFAGLQLAPMTGRFTATLENNVATSSIDLVITGPDGLTWTGAGSGVWNLSSANDWILNGTSTPATFLNSDYVFFNDSTAATANAVTIGEPVSPVGIFVDGTENYTFSGAEITGATALTKRGTGTLTFTNANSFTGLTTITAGTVSLGDGVSAGSLGTGAVALSGGQLVYNCSGADATVSNRITGTGAIVKLGPGRLLMGSSGPNTAYSGQISISEGEVVSTSNDSFGFSSNVGISSGASLDMAGHNWLARTSVGGSGINGAGAIRNSSTTAVSTLTSSLTLFKDTTVSGNLGMSSPRLPSSNRQLVSGNFKLTKAGEGTLSFLDSELTVKDLVSEGGKVLVGANCIVTNTYPGTITVNGGDFEIDQIMNYTTTCAKPIAFNNGATFTANGGPNYAVQVSGNIALNSPSTTITAESVQTVVGNFGFQPPTQLNLSGVVSGSGSLVMKGFGSVILAKAPTYTGDTTILGGAGTPDYYYHGKLKLMAPGLNDSSTVSISNGATLELAFTGTDVVDKLFINGVQQLAGVYTSTHPSKSFAGTGSLTVTSGPSTGAYQTWANDHGIPGAAATADADGDGITNGVEFILGTDPTVSEANPQSVLPTMVYDNIGTNFIYRRTAVSNADFAAKVSYNRTGLTDGWILAENGVNVVTIREDKDFYGPGIDKVTVRIPSTSPNLFIRLQANIP